MIEQYYCVSTILYIDLDPKKKSSGSCQRDKTNKDFFFNFLVGFEKYKSKKVQ